MVAQPDGLAGSPAVLARPRGGCQVTEIVADLEAHDDVALLAPWGHPDEEAQLVGFPEGHHAGEGERGIFILA